MSRRVVAAGVTLAALVIGVLAAVGAWVFRPPSAPGSPWLIVLGDRTTLGFIRLGAIAIVVYLLVSIPALIVQRRWFRGVGPSGVTIDDREDTRKTVGELRELVVDLTKELQRYEGLPGANDEE